MCLDLVFTAYAPGPGVWLLAESLTKFLPVSEYEGFLLAWVGV